MENQNMKTNERKYLEISTAHLKQKTLEGLNTMEPPYTYEYEEGIFMSVPDKNETNISDMPKDLRILLQYAWINGIDLIRMDRDANVIDDIPVYDWEKEANNEKLAEKICSCLSDGYDDEEYREGDVQDRVLAFEHNDMEMLKLVLNLLCERVEDMQEVYIK